MIDPTAFNYWFPILAERFNRTFSQPAIDLYLEVLSEKLDTNQFALAAERLFYEAEKLPTPKEFIDLGRSLAPTKTYQLPAETPPAWEEMTPEQRQQRREAIAQIRATMQGDSAPSRSGFSSIAQTMRPLAQEIAEKSCWLADPILRSDAIEWAMQHDAVEVVTDEETGGIVGLRSIAVVGGEA